MGGNVRRVVTGVNRVGKGLNTLVEGVQGWDLGVCLRVGDLFCVRVFSLARTALGRCGSSPSIFEKKYGFFEKR